MSDPARSRRVVVPADAGRPSHQKVDAFLYHLGCTGSVTYAATRIGLRRGRGARSWPVERHHGLDLMTLAGRVAERWDGDGAKPLYANKRAEMWGNLKDWLEQGALPADPELRADLCGVEYGYNGKGEIRLEKKALLQDHHRPLRRVRRQLLVCRRQRLKSTDPESAGSGSAAFPLRRRMTAPPPPKAPFTAA